MVSDTLSSMTSLTLDTIVAPATTYGKSSLNVIRLSGNKALSIASKITKKDSSFFIPRKSHLLKIYFNNNELLDECIIIYFKAPHSYTTEDVVEFQCHGGLFIAKNILEECIKQGARIAKGGEFTQRAFLGGRIDLTQAQAIAKLIETSNAKAHKMLMRHLKGEMQNFCETLRDDLIKILAHSEVFIDYADEELPLDLLENLQKKLENISKNLKNLLEQSLQKKNLFEGYKLCIIGKPNVGKSSLLNAFLQNNRAIVSEIAGTTRDSIEENFMLGNHLLRLIDTAGIRNSDDLIEQEGIKRSKEKAKESDLLITLFDSSRELDSEDDAIIDILNENKDSKKILVLLNKVDLTKKIDTHKLESFCPLSLSLNDKNIRDDESSFSKIKNYLEKILDDEFSDDAILLTSQYQYDAISNAISSILESKNPLEFSELELFSFHINEAIKSITSITRPYEYSQMLDVMFSDFCLGK